MDDGYEELIDPCADDYSKENVYDSRIAPLMEQIADIAKEYEISFVFSAEVARYMGRPLLISSAMLFNECARQLTDAKNVVFESYRVTPPPEDEM